MCKLQKLECNSIHPEVLTICLYLLAQKTYFYVFQLSTILEPNLNLISKYLKSQTKWFWDLICNIWHPAAAFLWDFKLEELGSAPISGKIHSINPPSNFFCRKKDQMQKQLVRLFRGKSSEKTFTFHPCVASSVVNNLYFQMQAPTWTSCIGTIKVKLPRNTKRSKKKRANSRNSTENTNLWHQTSGSAAAVEGGREKEEKKHFKTIYSWLPLGRPISSANTFYKSDKRLKI